MDDEIADDQAWSELLGPAHDEAAVAGLLGVTVDEVRTDPGLLRLTMRSGRIGYPVFQFDGDTVVEGVREVVEILTPAVASPWTIASWLSSRQRDTGVTAMDQLRDGQIDQVLVSARRSARRMAQ